MKIRNVQPADYPLLISVLNDWWGGRKMSDMLPKLFLFIFRKPVLSLSKISNSVALLLVSYHKHLPMKRIFISSASTPTIESKVWERNFIRIFLRLCSRRAATWCAASLPQPTKALLLSTGIWDSSLKLTRRNWTGCLFTRTMMGRGKTGLYLLSICCRGRGGKTAVLPINHNIW